MNSNSEIYSKYIKYKNKYINLQNKINIQQTGGTALASGGGGGGGSDMSSIDAKTFLGLKESDEIKYIPIKTTYKTSEDKDINLINIELNEDKDKPVLFMLAGASHESFKKSSKILLDKLDVLTNKFKNIYIIQYESFKEDQKRACGLRDGLDESKDDIYKPELDLNSKIADNVHNIIMSLGLTDVHLLGKCNGAWITLLLLLKNPIYNALYLAVPGIPSSVEILKRIDITRLQRIKFIFGWTQQDGFVFNWKIKSYQEKERYDAIIKRIENDLDIKLEYTSIMYDNGQGEPNGNYHEIYTDMIDEISK